MNHSSFQVLQRRKAFNAFSLINYLAVDLDKYFTSRLSEFARSRVYKYFLKTEKLAGRAAYLSTVMFPRDGDCVEVRNFSY